MVETLNAALVSRGSMARVFASPIGPRIMLAPPDEGGADDEAAKAAAEKAAADKAAAEKEAADKAAKDKLTDKEAELLKDLMKHKEAAKAASETAAQLQAKLKAYEGVDPEEFKRLKDEAEKAAVEKREAEKKAAEASGDFERVKAMMAEEHKRELTAVQEELKRLREMASNKDFEIDNLTIGAAFNASEFVRDMVLTASKARQVYGGHFERENGVIVAFDKPKGAAERTKLVDASGNPLGFEAAIAKIVEQDPDRDRMLKSKLKDGAGSKTVDGKVEDKKSAGSGLARISAALAAKKNG